MPLMLMLRGDGYSDHVGGFPEGNMVDILTHGKDAIRSKAPSRTFRHDEPFVGLLGHGLCRGSLELESARGFFCREYVFSGELNYESGSIHE